MTTAEIREMESGLKQLMTNMINICRNMLAEPDRVPMLAQALAGQVRDYDRYRAES